MWDKGTYFTHLIVAFDERVDGFDGQEAAFVHADDGGFLFEDVGSDDGGEVVGVHFASSFFVDG